jgi:hypothetical protein
LSRRARRKKPPKSALERLEQGRLTPDDLRVCARLLGRDDLAAAASAVERAMQWADAVEEARRGHRPLGPLLRDDDDEWESAYLDLLI